MRSHLRSERVKLPRVHRLMKGGKLYKWHRLTRKPLPADVPEDDPTFIAAWTAEEAAKPSPRTRGAPGSISAAWVALKRTSHFATFSAGYRAQIVRHGDAICAAYGDAPVAGLRKRHIEHDLSQLAPLPRRRRRTGRRLHPIGAGQRRLRPRRVGPRGADQAVAPGDAELALSRGRRCRRAAPGGQQRHAHHPAGGQPAPGLFQHL